MTTDAKIRLAIIDDHPPIIEGLKAFLGADGRFEFVGEFNDSRTALNRRFEKSPDLIILDLNLPGLDGEKSLPLLKQKFPSCRFLAFSQFGDQIKRLEDAGFDGYLNKTDLDPLRDTIVSIIAGNKHFPARKKSFQKDQFLNGSPKGYENFEKLTEREREIGRLVVRLYTSKEIGVRLHISESTVETHRRNIASKLETGSKKELHEILLANGLGEEVEG